MDALPIDDIGIDLNSAIGATPIGWIPGSTVQLCNVPWDSEYSNIVNFPDKIERDNYFSGLDSESVEITEMTYCFPNQPVSIDLEYAKAYTYNYIVVTNPKLPTDTVEPLKFYYFVTNVIYTAPNTTTFELMLDVWVTYQFNIRFGRGFLERGHAAWHAYANTVSGGMDACKAKRRYLTVPEGLDVGNDYINTNMEIHPMGGGLDDSTAEWTIVITSAVDLTADFGTEDNPKLKMATGMIVGAVPSACAVYGMEVGNFKSFMKAISDYPWISTNILSITSMPEGSITHGDSVKIAGIAAYEIESQGFFIDAPGTSSSEHKAKEVKAPKKGVESFLKSSVTALWKKHPKSRCYPYSYIIADNMCSTPLTLKPELFQNDKPIWYNLHSICPPFQRIFTFPGYYGAEDADYIKFEKNRLGKDKSNTIYALNGKMLQNALQWDDFPQYSILNDSYINYLASNARTIQYQRDNAGWQLDKSKAGNQLTYDNSMRSINAATQSQKAQRQFELTRAEKTSANAYLSSLSDTAGKISDSFGLGDSVGKYISLAQNSIAYTTGRAQSDLGQEQFEINRAAQTANAGANFKLSNWAAQGDYQNAIAGINATCQDAQLLSPTQSGTMGGGMYAILGVFGLTNWYLYAQTVNPEYQRLIGSYWSRFGYAVNDYVDIVKQSNLNLMSNFTYWKFQDLVVEGADVDETNRLVIKGIFEKGTTVYKDPTKITSGIDTLQGNEPIESTPLY